MPQQASLVFLGAALVAYLQGSVLYGLVLGLRRPRLGRWATAALLAGVAANGLGLLILWLESGRPASIAALDTLTLYAWLTVAVYLLVEHTIGQRALGALVAPLASLALLGAIVLPRHQHPDLAPFAHSLWLPFHVAISFAGYASLTLAFGGAVLYLFRERELKGRRLRGLLGRLPSLGTLEVVTYRLVEVGFVLLTATIVTGAVGAEQAWGSYWSWEPKETAALVTWLIYLGYFHLRNVAGWSGKQTARCAVAGFVAVLVTYLVVNLVLPGQHDFGFAGRL